MTNKLMEYENLTYKMYVFAIWIEPTESWDKIQELYPHGPWVWTKTFKARFMMVHLLRPETLQQK